MGKERKQGKKKRKAKEPSTSVSGAETVSGDQTEFSKECGLVPNEEDEPITGKGKPGNYNVKDLLEKAEDAIDSFNYELAQKFCERALELDPDNTTALETAGAVYLETGDIAGGRKCFERAVKMSPDVGHTKYLSLGQLCDGQDAIRYFQKGIELMIASYQKSSKKRGACAKTEQEISPFDISSAFCSLAEVYLTDSCFDDEAETKCQECCQKALDYDATNPEAYQVMTNYLLSVDNKKEALTMVKKSLELWLVEDETQSQANVPSFESRITTSKLLMELEDYESASKVLEGLLEENDEVVEVWYLLGWLYNLAEEKTLARFYLEKAKQLAERIGCQDQALIEHVDELLAVLPEGSEDEENDKLQAVPPEGSGNDEIDDEMVEEDEAEEEEQSERMDTQ